MMPPAMPSSYTAERFAPAFLPNRESHVTVPLLRSLITGGFFGLTAGVLTSYLAIMGKGGVWYSIELGLIIGGIVFFGGSFFYWLYITGQYDNLLSRVETVTGLDLNQDNQVGPPPKPEPRTIRVEVEQGKSREWEDFPGDEAALVEFAKDVVSNRVTFSEKGAGDSGYGIANFRELRDIFITRHWAEWKDEQNRQQGVSLYRAGRTILNRIAETPLNGNVPTAVMTNQYVERGSRDKSWG